MGLIIDYQQRRRKRPWIPGVFSPGKPNDYINLFLEETKVWIKQQFTLNHLEAQELLRRIKYYEKIKNDDYYWYVLLSSMYISCSDNMFQSHLF